MLDRMISFSCARASRPLPLWSVKSSTSTSSRLSFGTASSSRKAPMVPARSVAHEKQ